MVGNCLYVELSRKQKHNSVHVCLIEVILCNANAIQKHFQPNSVDINKVISSHELFEGNMIYYR